MKKILYFFIATSIFGCSKDNDSNNNSTVSTDGKLVKEVRTNLNSNTSQTLNYFYNANYVSKVEETESNGDLVKTVFNYDFNNRLQSLSYFLNGVANGSKVFDYYNLSDDIRSNVVNESGATFTYAYAYNGVGTLTTTQKLVSGALNSYVSYNPNNTNPNGTNSISETYYNSSNVITQKIDYVSDLKNTPYLNVFPSSYNKILFRFSVQNILTKTFLNGDIVSYEYIYSGNKPTQVIEKLNGVAKYKTTYSYQ